MYSVYIQFLFPFADITVNFTDQTYTVKEDNGLVQPRLIFSNPSSFSITIQVNSDDVNTTAG